MERRSHTLGIWTTLLFGVAACGFQPVDTHLIPSAGEESAHDSPGGSLEVAEDQERKSSGADDRIEPDEPADDDPNGQIDIDGSSKDESSDPDDNNSGEHDDGDEEAQEDEEDEEDESGEEVEPPDNERSTCRDCVRALIGEDARISAAIDGSLWVMNTESGGSTTVGVLKTDGESVEPVAVVDREINDYRAFFGDSQGRLWLAPKAENQCGGEGSNSCRCGAERIKNNSNHVDRLCTDYMSTTDNEPTVFAEDEQGNIYVGTQQDAAINYAGTQKLVCDIEITFDLSRDGRTRAMQPVTNGVWAMTGEVLSYCSEPDRECANQDCLQVYQREGKRELTDFVVIPKGSRVGSVFFLLVRLPSGLQALVRGEVAADHSVSAVSEIEKSWTLASLALNGADPDSFFLLDGGALRPVDRAGNIGAVLEKVGGIKRIDSIATAPGEGVWVMGEGRVALYRP